MLKGMFQRQRGTLAHLIASIKYDATNDKSLDSNNPRDGPTWKVSGGAKGKISLVPVAQHTRG